MSSYLKYSAILLMLIVTLSCSKTESFFYEVVEPEIVTGLSIHSSYLRNQQVTFEVFDSEGNNITMDSNFIVDGVSIVGNQISYPEIGNKSEKNKKLAVNTTQINDKGRKIFQPNLIN